MLLINLWVKDKSNGIIHQVGTDVHDSIELIDGEVHYHNLQNGCGTLDEYEWVEAPDLDDYVSVTPEQLYFNRELVHRGIIAMLQNSSNDMTKCKWCVDEFCTNADCPMMADCCPVYENSGVCKHELRDVVYSACKPTADGVYLCIYEFYSYDISGMRRAYGIGHFKDGRWHGEVTNANLSRVLAWRRLPDVKEVRL